MSAIKLSTPSSGSISLSPANTASNLTITVPAISATMATLTTPSFATTIGVGGATPAASGAGITFPATQSASTDANTLDDYEEGTWTPVVPATSVTYTTRSGTYTKIGNVVYIFCFVQISSISGASATGGASIITGLPFTSSPSVSYPNLSTAWSGSNWGGSVGGVQVLPNSTEMTAIGLTNNSSFVDSRPSDIWDASSNWVKLTGFYYV